MGRSIIIFGIWMAGFALGFIGYLTYPALNELALNLWPFLVTLDSKVLGAMIAGLASSLITVLAVSIWAYTSSKSARF